MPILINSKRNKIAPISVFFLLFISRLVNALTNIQSVTVGLMHTDTVISIIVSMGLTLLVSLPAVYCVKRHKNLFEIKWVGFFTRFISAFLRRFISADSLILRPPRLIPMHSLGYL